MGLVSGDPYGWQDIGYALSTLAGQLRSELGAADAVGGSGLAGSWSGPAARAYLHDWATRRSRYAGLLGNVQQAASAIGRYGQQVADLVVQAGRLEATWLGVGLELAEDGFLLPWNFESLPHLWQSSLRTALTESERDVARIRADAVGAYEELWTAVRDILIALEDFQFVAVSGIASFGRAYVKEELGSWEGVAGTGFDVTLAAFKAMENEDLKETRGLASQMSEWLRDGTPGERSVAGRWLPRLGRDSRQVDETVGKASRLEKVGDGVFAAIALIPVATDGYQDVRKEGWVRGTESDLEQNAGTLTSVALGGAEAAAGATIAGVVIAGAPVELVAAGGVVIGGAIAFGVGAGVQAVVNHRQAIGHELDKAASWEEEHVLGWL